MIDTVFIKPIVFTVGMHCAIHISKFTKVIHLTGRVAGPSWCSSSRLLFNFLFLNHLTPHSASCGASFSMLDQDFQYS